MCNKCVLCVVVDISDNDEFGGKTGNIIYCLGRLDTRFVVESEKDHAPYIKEYDLSFNVVVVWSTTILFVLCHIT